MCLQSLSGQTRVSGFVRDARSGEILAGANVVCPGSGVGTTSNNYGYFTLATPLSCPELQASYIGYGPSSVHIAQTADTLVVFLLTPGYLMDETTVVAKQKSSFLSGTKAGVYTLGQGNLQIPTAMFGENDLMRLLQTLPGIAQGKEGSSEIYVRGGGADQNLVLLDDAPVYNLNHAFGFLSLFNSEAIQRVTVQKGGIDARYGGRLSSVVDVSVREGNDKKLHGSYTMGLLGSSVMVEGPIKKEKSSFIVSARRSWADLLLAGVASPEGVSQSMFFYDINAKTNVKFNNHNQLFASFYIGADKMSVKSENGNKETDYSFGWGNYLATVRWNHLIDKHLFGHLTLYSSNYYDNDRFTNKGETSDDFSYKTSKFNETGLKYFVDWQPNDKHLLTVGTEQKLFLFSPATARMQLNGLASNTSSEKLSMAQSAIFVEDKWDVGKWRLAPGIRIEHSRGDDWSQTHVEPRVSVAYSASDKTTLKAAGTLMHQSMHAIRKSTMGWPGYFYVPSTNRVKPQNTKQLSLGCLYRPLTALTIDVDVWGKLTGNHLTSYHTPATAFATSQWDQLVEAGRGKAAGVDLLGEYKHDLFDVRLSYTLSRSLQQNTTYYDSRWFAFDYDRLHDISLSTSTTLSSNATATRNLNAAFSFRSGTPYMLPSMTTEGVSPFGDQAGYENKFANVDYYPGPNNVRMPNYHKLDLSYQTSLKKKNGYRTWILGINNVYNQQNAYIYYLDSEKKVKQITMFPIMPFVSFKRTF